MGLRKRPYNEENKGDKANGPRKRSATPKNTSGKDGYKRTPAKKSTRRETPKGDERFSRDKQEKKGTPRRSVPGAFGRKENDSRKPGRFAPEKKEGRAPVRRTTGNTRRTDADDTRKPGRFGKEGYVAEKGERRGGFNRKGDYSPRFSARDQEERPRTSKSGKPYMVKGAKARDVKAKSEEKLDLLIPEEIRLNRYISNSGICSRREADDLIAAGLVAVNGKIITEMGFKVKPGDEVRYNNERLSWEKKVYLLMNKPKDSITTSDDPEGRRIIMDLIDDPRLPRVYPVGRLDRNTTGVILLTNDGELAQRLTHPKYNITKVYKATLNKNLTAKDLQELANNGVDLEDGPIKPDVIGIPSASEKDVVMIQIHSGRNRIIHRMFEAMGYLVDKLDRIDFAGLERKGLDRGEWRHLDDKEIRKLKKLVQLK